MYHFRCVNIEGGKDKLSKLLSGWFINILLDGVSEWHKREGKVGFRKGIYLVLY